MKGKAKGRAKKKKVSRIVIAAPGSGRGKTTFVSSLLALLKKHGEDVRAFKCGPDYIDPMFHESVLGIPSKNLDTFFCGPELLRASLYEDRGSINVIEGVMGLYDGIGMTEQASTYELARILNAPIILCVDAHGMGRSAAAVIKGFQAMDDAGLIRGVFLNRVSAGYYQKLAPWLEETCGIPVVGFLPNMPEAVLKSRHLGLESPEENEALAKLGKTAEMLEETLDLAKLKQVAESAEPLDVSVRFDDVLPPVSGTRAVVAVAKDEAFSFFYKDNLTALQKCGLELRFFSPMRDEKLPEGASALVLYGGYPELYAKELSANVSMRESIRTACDGGMPVIAECGGFMYLQEKLKTADGTFDMVGVFPGSAENRGKLIRFGYVRGTDGMSHLRGHEFHHFDVDEPGSAWTMTREATGEEYPAMHVKNGVVAGFPHFYYYSDVSFVKRFAYAAEAFSNMTRAMGRIRL